MPALESCFESFVGRSCAVERRDADWAFTFGDNHSISVSAPWRLMAASEIAFGSGDDGHRFGLPAPIDGEARTNGLLGRQEVQQVEVDQDSGDFRIWFAGGHRLDVFNNSCGYEGWQAYVPGFGTIVGMGGGCVTICPDA